MEVDLQYRVEWRFSEPAREHHLLCRTQPCADARNPEPGPEWCRL